MVKENQRGHEYKNKNKWEATGLSGIQKLCCRGTINDVLFGTFVFRHKPHTAYWKHRMKKCLKQ